MGWADDRRSAGLRRAEAIQAFEHAARGWRVSDDVVPIEPPELWPGARVPASPPSDDARVPTLIERGWRRLLGILERRGQGPSEVQGQPEEAQSDHTGQLAHLRLIVPQDLPVDTDRSRRLFESLPSEHSVLAFEILASSESIAISLTVEKTHLAAIQAQLQAHLPGLVTEVVEDALRECWLEREELGVLVLDFGLSREFVRPIDVPTRAQHDPLLALYTTLSQLQGDELAVVQVRFRRCERDWKSEALTAICAPFDSPYLDAARELIPAARDKLAGVAFATSLRLGLRVQSEQRAWSLAQGVWRGLRVLGSGGSNELMPLDPHDYAPEAMERHLLERVSQRSGMVLSSAELAGLCHLPGPGVQTEKLVRVAGDSRPVPESCLEGELLLGHCEHAGRREAVYLPARLRSRHVHLIGASGTGKSTLMLQMALQDLEAGRGLAVVDPHGDLIDDLLARMPSSRHEDLVLVDPSDPEYSVAFNVLSASTDLEKQLLSSDLVASFKRLSTSWGDQMTAVLGNAVLAFLESPQGGTLVDLRRFLVEKEFRTEFLETVEDEEVRYFWEREFPLLSGRPQAPILTRLDALLRPKLVRHLLAQRESSFDLREVMDEGNVLLIKLAQGGIGEENAALLGALFVSRLQQAAQSRQSLAASSRRPFAIYLDEFQSYLTPSMSGILSGGRKYGLGLVLAHQDLSQLGRRESGLLGAAISNPATRICFRLGDSDARRLASGFDHYEAAQLMRLGVGQAVCRVDRSDRDFAMQTRRLPSLRPDAEASACAAVSTSREKHARLRTEIQAEVADARGAPRRPAVRESRRPSPPPPARTRETREGEAEERQATADEPGDAGATSSSSLPGRGGQEHRKYQRLVKELAQRHGWTARIEAKLGGDKGFVDVLLEKGDRRIGVEVSITTDAAHELENLRRCVEAGLEPVVVVTLDERVREQLRAGLGSLESTARVVLCSTDDALGVIKDLLDSPGLPQDHVSGYRVTVDSQEGPLVDAKNREALAALVRRLWRGA